MIEQTNKPPIVVFSPLYPPSLGGLQNHAAEFNHHLAQRGWPIIVFTPQLTTDTPLTEISEAGVKILRFPAFEIIPNFPIPKVWRPLFWQQWQQIKPQLGTIVISRTRFFLTSLLALFFARLYRYPLVHIEHGSDYIQLDKWWQNLIGRLYDHTLGYLVIRQATKVVANSQMTALFIQKLYPSAQPQVIYRGIESHTFSTTTPNTYWRTKYPQQVIVGYLGRLIAGKGVSDLINAMYRIKDTDAICLIIGAGPDIQRLQNLVAKYHLQEQIHFLGGVSREQGISLLKSCDIIVNPSYTEGLPTSVLEAAMCYKAIVATNVGGTKEIITDQVNGYLVPPRQPEQLATILRRLINDPHQRQTIGQAAWQSVQTKFHWPINIQQYENLFQELTHHVARH